MAAADLLAAWPVGAAGLAVVPGRGAAPEVSGAADVFAWASVTKVVTALAVLDAAADGVVRLDDAVGPPGATLAHLLAHAAGLVDPGARQAAPPGTRRTYSNSAYELAAAHVEGATGRTFGAEVRERVLDRLGMWSTALDGSPAHGMRGPVGDLALVAAELLDPRVLQPEVVAQASTLAFPGLAGVLPGFGRQEPNDWGLGCEIRASKSPHWTSPHNSPATFGHFGRAGGFLWVDPVAGVASASLSDTEFGPWAVEAWPEVSTAALGAR